MLTTTDHVVADHQAGDNPRMSESPQPALLRAVQELLDALAQLQPEDLTEADRDLLRALVRELQALVQLAH